MSGRENINRFLFALFGFRKTSSKGFLLLIVLVHATAWAIFLWFPLLFFPVRLADDRMWRREIITKFFPIVLFYVNYYFLLPRFFEKRKYGLYFLLVVVSLMLVIIGDAIGRSKMVGSFGITGRVMAVRNPYLPDSGVSIIRQTSLPTLEPVATVQEFSSPLLDSAGIQAIPAIPNDSVFHVTTLADPMPTIFGIPQPIIFFSVNRTISTCVFLLLLGGMIRLAYSFLKNQNEKKTLENANLNAEVNFLKSQINPHFLFNTLNSIYSQAHARSDKTEFSILRLSELLRYVLYDSGEEKVPLAKDIQYLNNYIDLQRMRLSRKVILNYTVEGDLQGRIIAPLLLINFIENAFKHGISYLQPSVITIGIHIFEETLTLSVINPVIEKDRFAPGGLGLKNVSRRLELLYAGKYTLDIRQLDGQHIVHLKLLLNHA